MVDARMPLDEAVLPRTLEQLERGLDDGSHAGVQLYVSLDGEVVADVALGEARPGTAMSIHMIVPWMSSGKPVTAAAALRLLERGAFDLDDPVTDHLPGFEGGGKASITVRHLLSHTAGLQAIEHDWPRDDWRTVLAKIQTGSVVAGWVPGERSAYDPANGWFVLGELVARWNGSTFSDALRELVLDPCDLSNTYCGTDEAHLSAVRDRMGTLYARSRGGLVPRTELLETPLATSPSPGGNVRGPIRELGRFHERLPTLLEPRTFEVMTSRQRREPEDETFRQKLDFGLGVIVDSSRYGADPVAYGYGAHCSDRTYGHGGVQTSIGFRDPERNLVVAWITNGQIGEPRHQRRNLAINTAIYEDLFGT